MSRNERPRSPQSIEFQRELAESQKRIAKAIDEMREARLRVEAYYAEEQRRAQRRWRWW